DRADPDVPAQARCRDQLDDEGRSAVLMAVRLPQPDELDVVVGPMRRRHLRSVLRIEQQVYPRPWSMGLFMSELGIRGSRVYLVARVGTTIVGYGGLMLVTPRGPAYAVLMLVTDAAHVTTLAVDPVWHRHKLGTRLLHALATAAIQRGAKHLT